MELQPVRKEAAVIGIMIATIIGQPAFGKGCIRGAVAGGIAGHYVGRGHALAGAAAGCVIAHHHYAQQARAQRQQIHR